MTLQAIGKTARFERLAASEAWTEAAIELIGLEAPDWTVKRLYLDDREWLCTLTRFPDVPDWLDESAEGRHPILALALLDALLAVRASGAVLPRSAAPHLDGAGADCADYR